MKSYLVRARRRDGGWDLEISGFGSTRVERLTGADRGVRAHLDLVGQADARSAAISYEYAKDLEREIQSVREGRASADAANRIAAERMRALASRLVADGYTGAEVAVVLAVSPQRVSQLVTPPRSPTDRATTKRATAETTDESLGPKPAKKAKTKSAKSKDGAARTKKKAKVK